MPRQNCPLCGKVAEFSGTDYGRRKAFNCETCTEYIISISAENRLEKAPQEWKDQLSEKTKVPPENKILTITVPDIRKQNETHQALRAYP